MLNGMLHIGKIIVLLTHGRPWAVPRHPKCMGAPLYSCNIYSMHNLRGFFLSCPDIGIVPGSVLESDKCLM